MSTTKTVFLLFAACAASLLARGQDTPPSLPQLTAPPTSLTEPVFPELPASPPPAAAAPLPQRSPAVMPPRPARLSVESTAGLPKQVQNVIDFYGGATSGRALAQLPQRPSSGSTPPAPARQMPKPFEGTVAGAPPTISPYMNLFLQETEEGLPNYHAFVRPMQQQLSTNAANRQQLHRLQQRVQQVSYGEAVTPTDGSMPGTGHGTRYFNTTKYYPTTRRLR